jgi:hypothetical protein
MSAPGRPKGEYRRAQPEGTPVSTPGRPKGEYRNAQHEGTPVNTLAARQQALRRAIVSPDGTAGDLLHETPGRDPLLRIYRHAYAERLIGALRDNFGCLPQVMGDEAFDTLARAYLAAHPSRHPSIRWFGDGLAGFMREHPEWVPHPALVDLARMEWALRTAFDAADATPMDATALASQSAEDWPALVFVALPGVQLLAMDWAVEPLWRAMQGVSHGDEPELPGPQAHAHWLLVWRDGLENRWRSVDDAQAALLRAMLEGDDFAALCARAAERFGEAQAAASAVAALQGWLGDGLIAGVRRYR